MPWIFKEGKNGLGAAYKCMLANYYFTFKDRTTISGGGPEEI